MTQAARTQAARSNSPILSLVSLVATLIALGGLITLGSPRNVLESGSLASLMIYVFGGAMAVLAGLGSIIRHEGKWSWIALSAIPLILIVAWVNTH
ncbi:MAG: hypothetical protein R2762_03795 [Bryobacteraceae bacterium]